jgi:hypothetical protein
MINQPLKKKGVKGIYPLKFVIIKSSVDDIFTYLKCEDDEEHTKYINFENNAQDKQNGLIYKNEIIDIVYGNNDTLKSLKIKYPKLII